MRNMQWFMEHAVFYDNGMLYITVCDYLPYNDVSGNDGIESTS